MSIKNRLAGKSANVGMHPRPEKSQDTPERPKTAPGLLMGSIPFLAQKEEEVERLNQLNAELREKLDVAQMNNSGTTVRIGELHETPGRRRTLSSSEYAELKSNLTKYPLITPITVRKRREGGYDIISGHNRVAVFNELGRDEILAIVQDFDDSTAELSALFANLFHPNLPDVQKFQGFKRLQDITGKSQREIAEESGVDPQTVSRWMSFEKLPPKALQLIESNPDRIGAAAATAFARIAKDGKQDAVIEAVQAVINGEITQEAGVKLAQRGGLKAEPAKLAETISIKAGKTLYCKMTTVKQTLRLDFQSVEERMAVETAIKEILQRSANKE